MCLEPAPTEMPSWFRAPGGEPFTDRCMPRTVRYAGPLPSSPETPRLRPPSVTRAPAAGLMTTFGPVLPATAVMLCAG